MGCDIHMHTERYIDGAWRYEASGPYDGRNYDLFWVLGEIQRRPGIHDPVGSYRGVPTDASEPVKNEVDFWAGDGHSHTWLSLAELQRWIELHPDQREIDGSEFWTTSLQYLSSLDDRPEHVRIVFWFDN